MTKKYIKYSLVVIFLMIISLIVYCYYNPSVDNKDFDLEYRVSNDGKDFYKERNKDIDSSKFSFNDERYYNYVDNYELIIHSLDIINDRERIIIVKNPLDTKNDFKTANITYKNKDGKYSSLKIEHKNDSVFIVQIIGGENNIIFKGIKIR